MGHPQPAPSPALDTGPHPLGAVHLTAAHPYGGGPHHIHRKDAVYTATDFFCGMGGSSTGLVEAGFDMKLAANHWDRAIETHAANHPNTEHLCADLQAVDVRYLPKTTILWASPICTEVSPAGGRRKKGHQLDLFEDHGHVPTEAFERTRVTFWEVIRAAEVHRYEVVLIENVVEAADWELFEVWVSAMAALGYGTTRSLGTRVSSRCRPATRSASTPPTGSAGTSSPRSTPPNPHPTAGRPIRGAPTSA